MHRKIRIALVFCILSATLSAKPYAVGVTLAPLCSFSGTEMGDEMAQTLLIASGEAPKPVPGPGGTVGGFAEFSPFSFLSFGAALDYAFRSSASLGQGTEGDGDSLWIFTHSIELNLYAGFNVYKGDAGIFRADLGVLAGLMPVGQSQRAIIDGYEISVSGDKQMSLSLGARVAFDWEWPLKIPAAEGSSFALRTGAGFEYLFLRTNFDESIPMPHSMSPSIRVGFVYRSAGKAKAVRELEPETEEPELEGSEPDGSESEGNESQGRIKP